MNLLYFDDFGVEHIYAFNLIEKKITGKDCYEKFEQIANKKDSIYFGFLTDCFYPGGRGVGKYKIDAKRYITLHLKISKILQ